MNLSPEDRARIEAEERYRMEVREKLSSGGLGLRPSNFFWFVVIAAGVMMVTIAIMKMLGALPNAIVAVHQYRTTSHLDVENLLALLLASGGLCGCTLCAVLYRKQKTKLDLLLREILVRRIR